MTSEPERYGTHAPSLPSGMFELGTRVLANEDGEKPLDVYAKIDEYDGGDTLVLYQGGDVIAFDVEGWEAFVARVRAVIGVVHHDV